MGRKKAFENLLQSRKITAYQLAEEILHIFAEE